VDLTKLLATWFGSGLAPIAPGTCGTLATVPLYLAIVFLGLPWWLVPLLALCTAALGVVVASRYEKATGRHDPPEVVIDETAGYLVACSFAPLSWKTAVLAFVFFRVLDACKPAAVQRLERLPGGWGVMADDLGAGAAAGVVVWLAWGLLAGAWLGPLSVSP
jgi:phosphatidylglycerophosphatase A